MKNKADLLAKMASLGAYPEVTDWVFSQGDDLSAAEIWARCERVYWLIWLVGRLNPHAIAAFAGRCALRAVGSRYAAYYASAAADAAANYADAAADAAAAHAAHAAAHAAAGAGAGAAAAAAAARYAVSAADAARYAAADAASERSAQLADLRSMWSEVSK